LRDTAESYAETGGPRVTDQAIEVLESGRP